MARKRTHRDVEFHVGADVFRTFGEAAVFAVVMAERFGRAETIDVVVWSKAGARWLGGDHGAEQYDEDPEASVFERIVVRAVSQGRVP